MMIFIPTVCKKYEGEVQCRIWAKGEREDGMYVELSMSMEDFTKAVIQEITERTGSVATVLTKSQFRSRMESVIPDSIHSITDAMKKEWLKHPY